MTQNDKLILGGHEFSSRFILGSGKYSLKLIQAAVEYAGAELITLAVRRANTKDHENILDYIPKGVTLLPNTSGARNAEEAVRIARLARELGCGDFVKIEIMRDSKYLLPDNQETVKATEILAKEGFVVMPYMYPDLYTARDLANAGAACVMPLASPIGSNKGLATKEFIQILVDEIDLPIIVDAGIGRPSQACEAMEMGAAAIMANTALATAGDLPQLTGPLSDQREEWPVTQPDDPLLSPAREVAGADVIVIGAPYWDLTFPAALKVYLEWACTLGITFGYTQAGEQRGLCRAERLIYITTAGGPLEDRNFGYEYVRGVAGMLGIINTHCVAAQGLDIRGNDPEAILREAQERAARLAAEI